MAGLIMKLLDFLHFMQSMLQIKFYAFPSSEKLMMGLSEMHACRMDNVKKRMSQRQLWLGKTILCGKYHHRRRYRRQEQSK